MGRDMRQFSMTWRNGYMSNITKANVFYINTTVPSLGRKVQVDESITVSAGEPPVAKMREGCKPDGAEHLLDQAVLEYIFQTKKNTSSTDEDAAKSMAKRKESRKEKQERMAKRKATFEKDKQEKENRRKERAASKRALELQNSKAQSMTANAISASVQLAARGVEQFGAFLSMYAARHNLTMPTPATPMPAPLQVTRLELANEVNNVVGQGVDKSINTNPNDQNSTDSNSGSPDPPSTP